MKTLRTVLVLITALAATAAFAGPRGKNPVPPSGSAAYREAKAETSTGRSTMIEKSGKRTSTVPCDSNTAKCKVHCGQ